MIEHGLLIGISGTILSTALKEKFPDIPAVLFTRKNVFKIAKYSRQALYSLDNVVYKNEVFQASGDNLNQLHALAVGFKNLRKKQSSKWDDILKVLKAPLVDHDTLKLSNPPLYLGFPSALERTIKTQVERSKCIYSGETPADWVCYILNEPVRIKYSLAYRVDPRPKVMDEARVSFKAIRTSNEVNDELLDPLGRDMLTRIRKGKTK